jgi:predicted DNA-binding transcriptional regulator AlpA
MNSNNDLLDLAEVSKYFGLSQSTIRRMIRQSREGLNSFPLPLLKRGSKIIFRRTDIENWEGDNVEYSLTPSLSLSSHQAVQTKDQAQTHRELRRKHGIDLSQSGDKNQR